MDFDIKKSEEKWRKFWEKEGIYKFASGSKKPVYSIDTPPPTVSGRMHMGHAFSYAQQDFIARYKRMKGFNVFYPFGADNNGVATERMIEKERKVRSRDMSREAFIKLCQEYLKQELPAFVQGWKNIGISCDFEKFYSTIDEHSRKISQWSFLDLYNKKRVYRKDAPSMWCPECQTGISQVEAQDKEIESHFNDIVFRVDGKDVIIATTRPELLPACVSVFYNPQDERYKKLKGKMARVPLFNFEVPIMEDSRVDKDKGTGLVMCCTFGDQTDMEWQKAYNLPIKTAIGINGKMTELAGKYKDMYIKEARKKIIEDLRNSSLLVGQKSIRHIVNVHERCGTEIEIIKSRQWFVKYLDLKSEMLKWGKQLNWHPDFMRHRYDNWVKGLQWDWLISRQRYFGIPFPVWYCEKCGETIIAEESQLPVDPLKDKPKKKCKCGHDKFLPEKDVLDTWFTSSLSPIISTRLLSEAEQKKVFPMSLRPQAHDIITFWLFNTVVKSNLHFHKNPWKDVILSGYVTLKGEKMSKSKGNVVDPQDIREKYGADALRYWASSSKLGEDTDYEEKEVVTGKKFITKILNASNFLFMNMQDYKPTSKPAELLETDRIFLTQLNGLIKNSTKNFDNYEYNRTKTDLDHFFWKVFCDNYLEIVKKRMYNGNKQEKDSASFVLYSILLSLLKMFAPITPFITEEVYQNHFKKTEKDKSIHVSQWPEPLEIKSKKDDEVRFNLLLEIISQVRQEKTKANKPMNSEIKLTLEPNRIKILGDDMLNDLKGVANADIIEGEKFRVEFK